MKYRFHKGIFVPLLYFLPAVAALFLFPTQLTWANESKTKRSQHIQIRDTDLPIETGEDIQSLLDEKEAPKTPRVRARKPPAPTAPATGLKISSQATEADEDVVSTPLNRLSSEERSLRDTAIDKIVIAAFTIELENKKERKFFQKSVDEVQRTLVDELNQKSYLEVSALDQTLSLDDTKNTIKDTARETGADGVVAGEIRQNQVVLALRSGQSGRTLSRWTVPYAPPLTEETFKNLMLDIVEIIVNGLPYRGFVTAKNGRQLKLNIGKSQGVKVGQKLRAFEFGGESPTFSSPQKVLGEIEITRVANQAAIGKAIGDKKIPLFAKIAFDIQGRSAVTNLKYRYYENFWASLMTEFLYLDTVVDPITASTSKRLFQLSLSPFFGFGCGKGGFAFFGRAGVASNTASEVLFLIGDGSYEFYRSVSERKGWILSGGLQYRRYQVKEVVPNGLVKTHWALPYGEAFFHYAISPRTKFIASGKLMAPVITQDEVLGTGNLLSFGAGATLGIRLDLSPQLGVEQTLTYERLFVGLENNVNLAEAQFGLRVRLFHVF